MSNILLVIFILVILIVFLKNMDHKFERFNLVNPRILNAPNIPFNEFPEGNSRYKSIFVRTAWFFRWFGYWKRIYNWNWKRDCNRDYIYGGAYNNPENFKRKCAYTYNVVKNDLKNRPCTKKYEFSRYCDFYSKHKYDYGRRKWIPINRRHIPYGQQSHCEQNRDLFRICCHSCSL